MKRTALHVRYIAQQAENSISLRWGIIDLGKVHSLSRVTCWVLRRFVYFPRSKSRTHMKDIVFVFSARETKAQVNGRVFNGLCILFGCLFR